mgnify:CR=1 FL=1
MELDPANNNTATRPQPRSVYTVIERDGGQRSIWVRVGAAWNNRDGSTTLRLDALPVNGVLQIRDDDRRDVGGAR